MKVCNRASGLVSGFVEACFSFLTECYLFVYISSSITELILILYFLFFSE